MKPEWAKNDPFPSKLHDSDNDYFILNSLVLIILINRFLTVYVTVCALYIHTYNPGPGENFSLKLLISISQMVILKAKFTFKNLAYMCH